MERPHSDAPLLFGCGGVASAAVATVLGWGFLIRGFQGSAHAVDVGVWMLGGSGLSLVFDLLAIGLGVTALLLRSGKRAPYALPVGIFAIVLGIVGVVGATVLGLLGLVSVAPGAR